jgi:hypothetical protein
MFVYLTNSLGDKFPVNATLVRSVERRQHRSPDQVKAYITFDGVHGYGIRETVDEAYTVLNLVARGGVVIEKAT